MPKSLPIDSLLAEIIDRAWLTHHRSAESYRVLPSIYTVIGFQFSGRIHHVGENRPLSTFGVTGILDTWRPFRSDAATQSLLVFFKPGGLYRIFGHVMGELGNDSLSLGDVIASRLTKDLAGILNADLEISEKWRLLQERFLRLLNRDLSPETGGALYHLQATRGISRIEHIAAELGVSRRTLERKFIAEVGTPPKHLARILRWNHAINHMAKYPDLATAALAHGYFDQAHFIRETRAFGGVTPTHLGA